MHSFRFTFVMVGTFELSELMMGKVALFNTWDKEMTEDEVTTSEGNLQSMSGTFILGPSAYMPEEVPCGEDNWHYFDFPPVHACKGNLRHAC